jgi:hypothetical protein
MSLHDAWTALRHGGNLLSPAALESLPDPALASRALADRLRAALADLAAARRPGGPALAALLDTVLDGACGLREGWRKSSAVGAAEAVSLLDGNEHKPRRIWTGPAGETLPVFVDASARIGVGKGRRSVAKALEYLRRRNWPLGLLTNGVQWRMLWTDGDSLAWVEWDAARWLDGDRHSDEFELLRIVLGPASLTAADGGLSPLLAGIRDTRRGQGQLSKELGERVRKAVETLLASRQTVLAAAWDEHDPRELYIAACRFVMRLVTVQFAEARELLPVDNPVYHRAYGLRGLLEQLDRQSAERRRESRAAWPRLLALFRLLHRGSTHPALTVPAYGGDLFAPADPAAGGVPRSQALLERLDGSLADPSDETVHRLLELLTRTTQRVREGVAWRRVAAPVDFSELTSEYIGILYEGLLDYELHRAGAEPVVFLALGDEPALPLDRLEAMEVNALEDLVKKAKVKKQVAADDDGDGDDDEEDGADEADDMDGAGPDDETEELPETEDVESDEDSADDARERARERAVAWGRRAVVAGKLLTRPRGRMTAERQAAWDAACDAAAKQLVADVKLPGELFLVRWGGTRKGAGTFYTRPQLALPTARRTLEPLLKDESGAWREPEALLALKVCDPAMGSGSFLVAALRVLVPALVESLHQHGRIRVVENRAEVNCAALPADDRCFPVDGMDERLEALVRRAVVEQCLYGVDLDPLAVELARVALWVETLDRSLPFTFLDHKLRCGNALVGCWLDRFRDYPLLAFSRQSADDEAKAGQWRLTHHKRREWHARLQTARTTVLRQQADLLRGQLRLEHDPLPEAELQAAVDRVRERTAELHAVSAGRPDERARIWRECILHDEALIRVRRSFDLWCALWFWPLERVEDAPLPSQLHAPDDTALAIVAELAGKHRYFHWELEFPDVFTAPDSGFDAVLGNPPWETLQPQSKEFFTNHDPLFRAYGKQEALGVQQRLFAEHAAIEADWLNYLSSFKDMANWLRCSAEPYGDRLDDDGRPELMLVPRRLNESLALYERWKRLRRGWRGLADPDHPLRHQGEGKAYTYKMFVELGHALLRSGGQFGLLVPSGLYTDKGSQSLRRLLLQACRWRWLYGFENRDKIFDIHRSFKFCVCIAEKGGATEAIQTAFMRHDLEDWSEAKGVVAMPAERVTAFSPKSLSILEIRSERDLEVLTKIYANSVLLGDDGPDGWGIRYAQGDFNMTSDSHLFIPRDRAEAQGYRPDIYGRWVNDEGEVLLPLYEGRMIGQFDFSEKGWVSGKGRSAVWREIPWEDKRIEPQYLMKFSDYIEAKDKDGQPKASRGPKLGFMDVGSATNTRTMISAITYDRPHGNKVPVLSLAGNSTLTISSLCTQLNSIVFDYAMRSRLGGLTMNLFIVEETPLSRLGGASTALERFGTALAACHVGFSVIWQSLIDSSRQISWKALWAITQHERRRQRAMLDAIVASLYGLDRSDFTWLLRDCDLGSDRLADKNIRSRLDPKGFWRIDKTAEPELRHTVQSLAAFDDLQRSIVSCDGVIDSGIAAFCQQNGGEGWMLPETLCIADLGMTRTVDMGVYDERAQQPQPVRSRMGPRFLPWQLEQTPEESWAECERHARAIREGMPGPRAESMPAPLFAGTDGDQAPQKNRRGRPRRGGDGRQGDDQARLLLE